MNEAVWRPIETAPKDGTTVMLAARRYKPRIWVSYTDPDAFKKDGDLGAYSVLVARFSTWDDCWRQLSGEFVVGMSWCNPTHWMPLPEPPQC